MSKGHIQQVSWQRMTLSRRNQQRQTTHAHTRCPVKCPAKSGRSHRRALCGTRRRWKRCRAGGPQETEGVSNIVRVEQGVTVPGAVLQDGDESCSSGAPREARGRTEKSQICSAPVTMIAQTSDFERSSGPGAQWLKMLSAGGRQLPRLAQEAQCPRSSKESCRMAQRKTLFTQGLMAGSRERHPRIAAPVCTARDDAGMSQTVPYVVQQRDEPRSEEENANAHGGVVFRGEASTKAPQERDAVKVPLQQQLAVSNRSG